jgi:hypothetical protein
MSECPEMRAFRHAVRRRARCGVCKLQKPCDELVLYQATIYDRGRFCFWTCKACRGRRERLKWLAKRSMDRLLERIRRQGFGTGKERCAISERLGLQPEEYAGSTGVESRRQGGV